MKKRESSKAAEFKEKGTSSVSDPISRPSHYTQGTIEVIDFIEDQKMDFVLGNAVKYLARYRFKLSGLADLKKARWYVDRLIAREERAL